MATHRLFAMPFGKLYPCYVEKAQRKNRTEAEVVKIICWLMGYHPTALAQMIDSDATVQDFIEQAPQLNEHRHLITGVVYG